ncbi:hypothetical protein DP59_5312 [Burkholderia pseudomallei]|nr:hypothetical protein DP59_5312 [Burkholderia pseudomallei]
MFEPKKRRTPLPCSSRRRPVARAASPRTAFACKERTSGGVIAGRRGGAGERHESGKKRRDVFYAPVGKSSAPRRARHVVYGGMRAPDIGIQAAIRSAPHARTERVRTARQAAASRSHGGKPRTRRGKRGKARAGLRLPAGSSAASVAPHARRGAARRNAARWTSERDGKKRQKPKRRAYGRAGMFNPRATAGRATNASSARATFG